jgi:hypothetical protein
VILFCLDPGGLAIQPCQPKPQVASFLHAYYDVPVGRPGAFMMKLLTRILITLAIVLLVLRISDWGVRRANRLPPVPQTNGYIRLVQLGAAFQRPPADLAELKSAEIVSIGRASAGAVGEARRLLNGPVQVPLESTSAWANQHAEQLKQLKKLGVLLAIQARAQVLETRTNDAAECEFDMVRLGQTITHGGVLVDGLTGLTIELIGVSSLRNRAGHLNASACRRLAQALEASEARREPAGQILEKQTQWADATFGLISKIESFISRGGKEERYRDFNSRYADAVRRTRRLILVLAARAYQLETGRAPARPADLVPGILKAIPLDPFTGKPIPDIPSQPE